MIRALVDMTLPFWEISCKYQCISVCIFAYSLWLLILHSFSPDSFFPHFFLSCWYPFHLSMNFIVRNAQSYHHSNVTHVPWLLLIWSGKSKVWFLVVCSLPLVLENTPQSIASFPFPVFPWGSTAAKMHLWRWDSDLKLKFVFHFEVNLITARGDKAEHVLMELS